MGLPQLMWRLLEYHRMLRPVIHGHPRLWFVLIVVTLFATAPSITGNNDITDGEGSNNVESYEDVGDGVAQYDSKITHRLPFGRGSSSKEPGEMPGDDLQGNIPSYATHTRNSIFFTKIWDLLSL